MERSLLLSAEFRNATNHAERFATISSRPHEQSSISDALGVSRYAVRRATIAVNDGRTPFQPGGQMFLTKNEIHAISLWIRSRINSHTATRVADIKEQIDTLINQSNISCPSRSMPSEKTLRRTIKRLGYKCSNGELLHRGRSSIPLQDVASFFDTYEGLIEEHLIPEYAVYNMDETGLTIGLASSADNVIAPQDHRKPLFVEIQGMAPIKSTSMVTVAASGYALPTLLVLPRRGLDEEVAAVLSDLLITSTYSESVWSNESVLRMRAEDVFIAGVLAHRRRQGEHALLIVDGSSTMYPSKPRP